ncbi:coiled-coil domain-containing protein 40 [Macrosteles quadrilineatus]|uniref:coiled-coil domain-containing protein 40 n=1 Tax=Macrosteles quadrilineatus TaxID=74068 RepID=UPI0023E12C14|nr:coiled-coil domain-containing protein 40 [Macrosteles quadrilineatus]XP_054271340.1 coiled-coil domain-containing protein 40 [Macrosteles quadrilineatus]
MEDYIDSGNNDPYNNESVAEDTEEEEGSGEFHPQNEAEQNSNHGGGSRTLPSVEPQVLQPDNPLMERFQNALQTHLLNQRKKLDEEILGLKINLKDDTKSYQTSIEVRDLEQQAVLRQNISMEKERETTEKVITDREKIETDLQRQIDKCKETSIHLSSKINKEEELRLEKESLAALITQFSEWEQSQNSEITIAQRISEKTQTNKHVYTQEKIYQDLLLVSLTSEVLKLSTKFGELEKNIKQKQSEVEVMSQSVADGNADLEGLERENKRLMQIWNHVIQQIQQRDRIMVDIKAQLLTSQEQYSRLVCQVESYKRSSGGEIKKNETLTHTLVRLEGDREMLERVNAAEEQKQRKMRENLVQVANMVELTQRDVNVIAADTKEKEVKFNNIQIEIDKLMQIKYQLEEQMLKKLHHQVVLSKAEKQSAKKINSHRANARKLESQLAGAQNELAKVLLLIEQENKLIKENTLILDQEKQDDIKRDRELKESEMGLKRLYTLIGRKRSYNDTINIRLVELSQKTPAENLTPDELQLVCLEKTLTELVNNIEELHTSWMREQSRIVALTQQRNNLLNQLTIYHKQILVMKQKQLKTEFEIEHLKKEETNMKRLIGSLEKRLTNLNLQCSQRKDYKESLDNQNMVAQNQLICDLKDAEVRALTLQEEMCYLEIDKEEMRGRIVEAQRDLLAWERKLQMATEVKCSIDKARADGGEIAVMKSEIHRMEVRYAQLQKVQEKLAHDMEMCISRRDGIVELAQAREKRSTRRALYTRQQFQKKLDDLQTKIKQTNSELKSVNKSIGTSEEHLTGLAEREDMKKNQLAELQTAVAQMQAQLAEGQLHRQKNLEMLVRKQRKARQYGELKAGRYSLQHRQESALELETQKQKAVNSDLVSIVESLNTDFPILDNPMMQILNTLRSPAA